MGQNFPCLYGFANTGVGRMPTLTVPKKIFFVPTFRLFDGQRNGIYIGTNTWNTNATFTQPAWGAQVNVTFTSTVGLVAGMILNIPSSTPTNGWYEVMSVISSTHAMLMSIGQPPVSTKEGATVATTATATLNGLVNGQLPDAYFQCMLNHPQLDQRWYPSPELKDADDQRADYIFQTFKDQTKYQVHQGVRSYKATIPGKNASPFLLGVLKTGWTVDMSEITLDSTGNLSGTLMPDPVSGLNVFYPRRIDSNSIAPNYNRGDDTTVQDIMLEMDILALEQDEQIAVLQGYNNVAGCGDIAPNVNFSLYTGLLNVSSTFSNIASHSAGTFTMSLKVPGGSAGTNNTIPDTGLNINNMISPNSGAQGYVYDVTAAADVAITSVIELTDAFNNGTGTYNVVLASDIASSLNKVAVGVLRAGRDNSRIPCSGGQNPSYSFISD